jgi:hypothetical protein
LVCHGDRRVGKASRHKSRASESQLGNPLDTEMPEPSTKVIPPSCDTRISFSGSTIASITRPVIPILAGKSIPNEEVLRLIQIRLKRSSFEKTSLGCRDEFAASRISDSSSINPVSL